MVKRRKAIRPRRFVKKSRMVARSRKVKGVPKSLPLTGFPKCKMVRLRYVETVALDPGAALISFNAFVANDMFDPNTTGIGHQPRGFDQNMTSYNHFTVLGAKCTATYLPTAASDKAGIMGILLTATGTGASSFTGVDDLLESQVIGKSHVVCGGINRVQRTVTKKFSAKKFFCIKNFISKDLYRGSAAGSPSEKAYFEVMYSSTDANDPSLAKIRVTIDYIAMLTEPRIIGGS